MITLDRLFELLALLLGGGFLASLVANSKNKDDDKQKIIDQLQEDRKDDRAEINALKNRVDELYESFRKLEREYGELAHENRRLKWEAEKKDEKIKKKDEHIAELELKVEELENRVSELEEKGEGN